MASHTKPFSCQVCKKQYTGKDNNSVFMQQFPCILSCGHSICISCLKKKAHPKKILCPFCQRSTCFKNEDKHSDDITPDYHALGVLTNCSRRFSLNLNLKMVPIDSEKKASVAAESNDSLDSLNSACHQCKKMASWYCERCSMLFCTICFCEFHQKNSKIQTHTAKPLHIEEYRKILQNECSEHNRYVEYYCEDDSKLLCSLCTTGTHKGHTIYQMAEKNEALSDTIQSARDEAAKICNNLKASRKLLLEAPSECSTDVDILIKDISENFHELHSLLQLREMHLVAAVKEKSNETLKAITSLAEQMNSDILHLKALISDADLLLNNPQIAMHGLGLLKKLMQTKETPCFLVPLTDDKENSLEFAIEDEIRETIGGIGKIQAHIAPKFTLVAEHELPTGFNKEEHVPKELDTTVDKEEVIVTHIRSPSSFFVQRVKDAETFSQFTSSINIFCKNKENRKFIPTMLQVGELYLAKYHLDGVWYRARVQEVIVKDSVRRKTKERKNLDSTIKDWSLFMENYDADEVVSSWSSPSLDSETELTDFTTEAKVTFIDYGNTEKIKLTDMRTMQPQFGRLATLSLECCLWDILPIEEKWSKKAVRYFSKFTANRNMVMKVIEEVGGVLQVDLLQPAASVTEIENDTPISVREALIFVEEALYPHGTSTRKELNRTCKHQSFYNPDPLSHSVKMRVKTSHVESPSKFYVRVVNSSYRYYGEMFKELQDYYSTTDTKNDLSVYYPQKGLPYVTMIPSENGDLWSRVLAEDFPGNGTVKVRCVDSGYTAVVHCSELRKITDSFLKLPMQAHTCHLADIGPLGISWTLQVIEYFKDFTMTDLHMVVHNNSLTYGNIVSIYEIFPIGAEVSLNVRMVMEGLARSLGAASIAPTMEIPMAKFPKHKSYEAKIPQRKPAWVAPSVEKPTQTSTEQKTTKLVQLKKKKPPIKVTISYYESPNVFYIQMADAAEELQSLKRRLRAHCHNSQPVNVSWVLGSLCLGTDPNTREWSRGQICKVLKEDVYEVFFYDFGYKKVVSSSNLRKQPKDFDLPIKLAIKCSLGRVRPAGGSSEWTKMACELMEDLTKDCVLLMGKVTDGEGTKDSFCVDLFKEELLPGGALEADTLKQCSIVEELIKSGLALPLKRGSSSSPLTLPEPVLPYVFVPPIYQKWLPQSQPKWQNTSALTTFVGYDGCFHLHSTEMEASLTEISDGLLEVFRDTSRYRSPKEVVREGQICSARYQLDGKWYRARINKVSGSTVELTFVDYGNMEMIKMEDIRLHVAYTDIPVQCYECELHNARPISENGQWPKATLDYIHQTIVEKLCVINLEDPGLSYPEKRLQISLTLFGGVSLLDHLVERQLVRRIRSAPQEYLTIMLPSQIPDYGHIPLPPPGVQFPVIVTHVADTGHLFLQRLNVDEPRTQDDITLNREHDRFLAMMENLSEIGEFLLAVDNPKPEGTYCVQYSHDKLWYRALVTSVSKGWATVIYIDYGNPEDIPLSSDRIRELPKKFLKYPKQSFIGRLHDIEPVNGIWEMDLNKELMRLFHAFDPDTHIILAEIKNKVLDVPDIELYLQDDLEAGNNCLAYQPLIDAGLLKKL